MKFKISFILILPFFIINSLHSQSVFDKKLNDIGNGNLDLVLSQITGQHQIKFSYNRARAHKIDINKLPANLSLNQFLTEICKEHKLKFYLGTDSIIYIINRFASEKEINIQAKKSYVGEPTRYDLILFGKIRHKYSQEALPYVNIKIKGSYVSTISNNDGFFALRHIPSDTSSIEITHSGYRKQIIFLTPEMVFEDIVIEMEPQSIDLKNFNILEYKRNTLQPKKQNVLMKLQPIKLKSLPNMGDKDILRPFQLMSGVSAANDNSSGLYVRGGTPYQSLVLFDGFTVYNVEHLFGFHSAFNSNAIKDVQFYKSWFGAKFGGRLSNVLEIKGKDGDRQQFNALAELSLMSVNAMIEFPLSAKFSAMVAARQSWKKPIYTRIIENLEKKTPILAQFGGENSNTPSSNFYDINTKLTFYPTLKDLISLSFYNGKDILDNNFEAQSKESRMGGFSNLSVKTMDITNWGNTGTSLRWSKNWTNKFYSNILASYSNYYSDRKKACVTEYLNAEGRSQSSAYNLLENNRLHDLTLKAIFEYNTFANNLLSFGMLTTKNNAAYSFFQNGFLNLITKNEIKSIHTAYYEHKTSLFKSKVNLINGLRANYYDGTKKYYLEPRYSLTYLMSSKWKTRISIGRYFQFAKSIIRDDVLQGNRDFWAMADNAKLPVSKSDQISSGFSYETSGYLFDIEAYYNKQSGLSEYSTLEIRQEQTVTYERNIISGTGISKGIDALVQRKIGDYSGWISYSLAKATNRYPELGNFDFFASNTVTHEIKIIQSYKWRSFNFAAIWIFTTGRPYTSPVGGYQITLSDGISKDFFNVAAKNGTRFPNYHRLDFSATYSFKIGTASPCKLGLSLFNIYNRQNVWYYDYQIVEKEIIKTNVNFLGFSPNINLIIKLH